MKDNKSSSKSSSLTTIDGQPIEIPEEGALGLLALGYRGLLAWREKRYLVRQQKKEEKNT